MDNPYHSNHFIRAAQADLKIICQPLFKKLELNYFHYYKVYEDGSAFIISTNMAWVDYFWSLDYKSSISLPTRNIKVGEYNICLWRGVVLDDIVSKARNLHNFDHQLEITRASSDYFEVFTFGTAAGNDGILNVYFNNLNVLIDFIDYFKEQANDLIHQADSNRFTLSSLHRPEELKILKDLDKGLTIVGNNGVVKLTVKEFNILISVCQGLRLKDVADIQSRSLRTIETHYANLQEKLNCHSKSELIKLALQNKIKLNTI